MDVTEELGDGLTRLAIGESTPVINSNYSALLEKKQSACQYLLDQCARLPKPLNNILEFLSIVNGVVAGSFVVKAFFQTDPWEPNDIDIWLPAATPSCSPEGLVSYLESCGWTFIERKTDREYDSSQIHFESFSFSHGDPMLARVPVLNLVATQVTASELETHLQKSFDLNGCTATWRRDGTFNLAMDWADFFARQWKFIPAEVLRLRSYRPRLPVTATRRWMFDRLIQYRKRVLASRIRKYVNRGFVITNATEILLLVLYGGDILESEEEKEEQRKFMVSDIFRP